MPRANQTIAQHAGSKPKDYGRGHHIRTLLQIFHLAGVTSWSAFGRYLEALFYGTSGGPLCLVDMSNCRHYTGNLLGTDTGVSASHVMWAIDCCCATAGKPEYDSGAGEGKAMYVKMPILCDAARAWIKANKHNFPSAQGKQFEQGIERQADISDEDLEGSSGLEEDLEDLEGFLDEPGDNTVVVDANRQRPTTATSDDMVFSPQTTEIPEAVTKGKQTAKMRIHNLAFLLGIWSSLDNTAAGRGGNATALKTAVGDLCNRPEVSVLHLCGCGISGPVGTPRRMACVKPSHLVLGDARLNRLHAHWHECLETAGSDRTTYRGLRKAIIAKYQGEYAERCRVF